MNKLKSIADQLRAKLVRLENTKKRLTDDTARHGTLAAEIKKTKVDATVKAEVDAFTEKQNLHAAFARSKDSMQENLVALLSELEPIAEQIRQQLSGWASGERQGIVAKVEKLLAPYAEPITEGNGAVRNTAREMAMQAPLLQRIDSAAQWRTAFPESHVLANDPAKYGTAAIEHCAELLAIVEFYFSNGESFIPPGYGKAA